MTQYLSVIGNIKLLWKSWTTPVMTVKGYEDVTSPSLEFSLASQPACVGCGHNLDGEGSVNLHQALYESINYILVSKTSTRVQGESMDTGKLNMGYLRVMHERHPPFFPSLPLTSAAFSIILV